MGWKLELKSVKKLYDELGLSEHGKVQKFLDKTVGDNLKKYVSFAERCTRKVHSNCF